MRYAVKAIITDPTFAPTVYCEENNWFFASRGRERQPPHRSEIFDNLNDAYRYVNSVQSPIESRWYYIIEEYP